MRIVEYGISYKAFAAPATKNPEEIINQILSNIAKSESTWLLSEYYHGTLTCHYYLIKRNNKIVKIHPTQNDRHTPKSWKYLVDTFVSTSRD